MPNRDAVRSLSRPNNGLHTSATNDPVAAISERLDAARSVPTSELTFSARVTSRGAMKTRLVARYAAAYDAMNVQLTGARGCSVRSVPIASPPQCSVDDRPD